MPNWCYNSMSVHGERSELERLTKAISCKVKNYNDDEVDGYDLSVLFPVPDELRIEDVWFSSDDATPEQLALVEKYEANMAKYGYKTWYDWSIANWGTKWRPDIEDWELNDFPLNGGNEGESIIDAFYKTAWSPCGGLIREISKQFPTLLFSVTSDEEGGSFACCEAYKDGVLVAGYGYDLPDGENLPDELRQRRIKIDEAIEGAEYGSDEWDSAWEDHNDWNTDVRESCGDVVWNTLRDKGLVGQSFQFPLPGV